MSPKRLTTAVVGAGPAGLVFVIAARALWAKRGHEPEQWKTLLFDKRTTYERTHRLRMDPRPYRALAEEASHPIVDDLIAFLEGERWRPAVSDLEQQLSEAAGAFGVAKQPLEVGGPAAEIPLATLAQVLRESGDLDAHSPLTVVGADSVRSQVRDAIAGPASRVVKTHQGVARLILRGPELPEALSPIEQLKLSKLLGSILDYRRHPAGFAEVDLFLSSREFGAVERLGAIPKAPIVLDDEALDGLSAPLFRRIVAYLAHGFCAARLSAELWSTFKLEHALVRPTSFPLGDDGRVFLVGDAATSLPFFRGMACLGESAHRLAKLHVDLAAMALGGEDGAQKVTQELHQGGPSVRDYEAAIEKLRADELAIVGARARLIRVAREFVRVSAMAPFPIQSWLLSVPEEPKHPRERSAAFWLNLAFATVSLVTVLAGPVLSLTTKPALLWISLLALPIQAAGGVLYHYTRDHLPRSLPLVATTWRLQIAVVAIGGLALSAWATWTAGTPALLPATVYWFVLGLTFVVGLYAFEKLWQKWATQGAPPHAAFPTDSPPDNQPSTSRAE